MLSRKQELCGVAHTGFQHGCYQGPSKAVDVKQNETVYGVKLDISRGSTEVVREMPTAISPRSSGLRLYRETCDLKSSLIQYTRLRHNNNLDLGVLHKS